MKKLLEDFHRVKSLETEEKGKSKPSDMAGGEAEGPAADKDGSEAIIKTESPAADKDDNKTSVKAEKVN